MSAEPDPIPDALLDLLLVLQEDPAYKKELLRLLELPEKLRGQALRNLQEAMRDDPKASPLREALQAAEDPVLARAMAEFLRDS